MPFVRTLLLTKSKSAEWIQTTLVHEVAKTALPITGVRFSFVLPVSRHVSEAQATRAYGPR